MAHFSADGGDVLLHVRCEQADRDIHIDTDTQQAVMYRVCLCSQFKEEPGNLLVTNEDIVWPFDQGTEIEFLSYSTGNGDGTRHRDHEDMIDRHMGFQHDRDPDPPCRRDPRPAHTAYPPGLLFSDNHHSV